MQAIRGRLTALLLAVSAVVAGTVAPVEAGASASVQTRTLSSFRAGTPSSVEAGRQGDRRGWTGTWATAASEHYEVSGMSEVTVRMPVHTSVGGSSVRIRLTNAYASDPITIGHWVPHASPGSSVIPEVVRQRVEQ